MRYIILAIVLLSISGCDGLRFAPTQEQKQNAWLHERTLQCAADLAGQENSGGQLQELIGLAHLQSRSFMAYFGLPDEFAAADGAEQILAKPNFELAQLSHLQSQQRPDSFDIADNLFELGIGISALLGGVYGGRAVSFLRQARVKSQALKEIIEGNELFKREHKAYAGVFKQAQQGQSASTRQIVAEIKTAQNS